MSASTYTADLTVDAQRNLLMQLLKVTATTQAHLVEGTGVNRAHISTFLRNMPGGYISQEKLQHLLLRLGWLPDGQLDPARLHRWTATVGVKEFVDTLAPGHWRARAIQSLAPAETSGPAFALVGLWVGPAPVLVRDTGRGQNSHETLRSLIADQQQVSEPMKAERISIGATEYPAWLDGTITRQRFAELVPPPLLPVSPSAQTNEWQPLIDAARHLGLTPEQAVNVLEADADFRCLINPDIDQDWLRARKRVILRNFSSTPPTNTQLGAEIVKEVRLRRERAAATFAQRAEQVSNAAPLTKSKASEAE